jgi:hypothetical protein
MAQRTSTPPADPEIGTELMTVDGRCTVVGRPAKYGEFRVRFEDGTEANIDPQREPYSYAD